jgi:Zn-dependent peptidase ImmA (M78 family)/DNA-binding XRE family transcriptional regulator
MAHKLPTSMSKSSAGVPKARRIFNPKRLDLVRRRMGLTKVELATQLEIDPRSLSGYESGEFSPRAQTINAICRLSGYPSDFFFGDDLEEPHTDTASFRAMAKMKANQREMALSQGALAFHFTNWIEKHFELPKPDLPNLSNEGSPEAAANSLRRHWGIGELSIRNIVHLLESKGVRIFSLAIDAREVDAFSLWKESTPFIFLNNYKSSERSRFDAAHELGHLCLHGHGSPRGREPEREADEFASSFLMPRASVIAYAPTSPTLRELIKLKKAWTVSVAALNARLYQVEMLSEWQYRNLCIQISKHGYRTSEPNEAPRETSQVLPKMFDALYKEGIKRPEVAKDLCIPPSELEQLMFGLTLTSIRGGGRKSPSNAKPKLALVGRDE